MAALFCNVCCVKKKKLGFTCYSGSANHSLSHGTVIFASQESQISIISARFWDIPSFPPSRRNVQKVSLKSVGIVIAVKHCHIAHRFLRCVCRITNVNTVCSAVDYEFQRFTGQRKKCGCKSLEKFAAFKRYILFLNNINTIPQSSFIFSFQNPYLFRKIDSSQQLHPTISFFSFIYNSVL